jgi:hypothetical protein
VILEQGRIFENTVEVGEAELKRGAWSGNLGLICKDSMQIGMEK